MTIEPLRPIDTRHFFRPVSTSLVTLLRELSESDWQLPTVAGSWLVRDIVAHLLDTTLRRLSFHRDGMAPPPPTRTIATDGEFVAFINELNAQWVTASRRLSPRVLTDLYEHASVGAADWWESQSLDAPALFPVSWAGEEVSRSWMDIGREFTELWHHQQQIRMAVGADSLDDPRYLRAVLALGVRALPHAYRLVEAEPGASVVFEVSGDSGGTWTLTRAADRWTLADGEADVQAARVRIDDDAAWQLLFNALSEEKAAERATVTGRAELARPLFRARSVIV
jgi:uncharacterized protein (TIGR03083 family)